MNVTRTPYMQDEQLLTPREASRRLGITVTTLAQWARSGRLPATLTPGGHRRYRLTDLQTLQATREPKLSESTGWERDAVRLYQKGWSIRQVAEHFNCGYGIMRRVLVRRTTLRTRGSGPRG